MPHPLGLSGHHFGTKWGKWLRQEVLTMLNWNVCVSVEEPGGTTNSTVRKWGEVEWWPLKSLLGTNGMVHSILKKVFIIIPDAFWLRVQYLN